MKKNLTLRIALTLGMLAAVILPFSGANFALAQGGDPTPFSIENVGSRIGLGGADLKETVINIIELLLGLMTLVAVSLIIYGGFVWLTAAGNESNVDKAKSIISAAVIGLIIVLLAWAIVIFVARTTANVTNTSDDVGGGL